MRPRSNMELNPEDLAKITDFTLSHYNEHAEDFWEGTRDHNVNQNITALLQGIEGEPPYTIRPVPDACLNADTAGANSRHT